MDFSIPHNICVIVHADINHLLDLARQHGLPAVFPGALYLSGHLESRLSSSGSTAAAQ
jgi:hypothetical protein